MDQQTGPILVVGEALVDIVERIADEPAECPGGSPANLAVALARLGWDVELVTWLGRDQRGEMVRRHLQENGVQLSAGSSGAKRTSTARASIAASGSATYVFDLDWSPPAQRPKRQPLVVHTGSIAAVLDPGAAMVTRMVDRYRPQATITYDPNIRPQLMTDRPATVAAVEWMVGRSDVVKVSEEDLAWLYPTEEPLSSARRWLREGPALVCVTRGSLGSWVTTLNTEVTAPARAVRVVDTVGAGDSFMGGLIDGLGAEGLLGADRREELRVASASLLRRLLNHSAAVAAVTVSRTGANPPTREEVVA